MCVRGGRSLALKSIMDTAFAHERMLHIDAAPVKSVFVFRHYATPENVPDSQYLLPGRDVDMKAEMNVARPYCPCTWLDSEDPVFIFYTSGHLIAKKKTTFMLVKPTVGGLQGIHTFMDSFLMGSLH